MKIQKNNKGITLIVLIITIIVMIILAAVVIRLATGDNGVIKQGEKAGAEQKFKTAAEQVQSEIVYNKDTGKVDLENTLNNIKNNQGTYAVTVKSIKPDSITANTTEIEVEFEDGNIVLIDKNGEVEYKKSSSNSNTTPNNVTESEIDQELVDYILGNEGTGRPVFDILDPKEGEFIQDQDNPTSTVYQDIMIYNGDQENMTWVEFIYNGRGYHCETESRNGELYTKSNGLTFTHVGQEVHYGNYDYIIISEDTTDGTVEMVSKSTLGGDITLGDTSSLENTINDYNSAFEKIITACKNATGLTIDGEKVLEIRSVGNTKARYKSTGYQNESYGYITSSYLDQNTSYDKTNNDWFSQYDTYNLENGNKFASNDYVLSVLGILNPSDNKPYWVTTRQVEINDHDNNIGLIFYVKYVEGTQDAAIDMFEIYETGAEKLNKFSFPVRPVVTVKASELGW